MPDPQLGLSLTAPDPEPSLEPWHDLAWTNGRHYRWRLDTVRTYERDLEVFVDKAPGDWRWELEVRVDDQWRPVRNYARRDEIWAHVRTSQELKALVSPTTTAQEPAPVGEET